jgi:NADPH:quinone reductase-like Zn-dependent oxidoreductase
MRAAVLTPTRFKIRELDRPAFEDGELLIQTVACGVCSGDSFVYENREELAATHSRLGHEASGLVQAVGRCVTGFSAGDVVTALSTPAFADYFVATPGRAIMAVWYVAIPEDIRSTMRADSEEPVEVKG